MGSVGQVGDLRSRVLIWALLAVAGVACLPTFGRPYDGMEGWADQQAAVRFLSHALAGRWAEAFALDWMGPGWMAAGKAMYGLFRLETKSALLLVNRLCYFAAAFCLAYYVLWHSHLARAQRSREALALGGMALGTFFLSVNFSNFSTVVWSHFIALPFVAGIGFLLANIDTGSRWRALLIGVLAGYLATIRMFEVLALGVATATWLGFILIRRRPSMRALARLAGWLGGLLAVGFVVGYSLHAVILGKFHFFMQYSAAVEYPESALYSMRFFDLPVKLVQLFIDPCFLAMCADQHWSKDATLLAATDIRSFYYPAILQVPIVAWILIAWGWMVASQRRRMVEVLEDPGVGITLLAAIAVVVSYSSVLYVGSDRLKYGFIREFMSATFLAMMATARAMALLRQMAANGDVRRPPLREGALIVMAPVIAIGLLQLPIKGEGFVKFPSWAIREIGAAVNCDAEVCRLSPYYVTNGERMPWPNFYDRAILSRRCAEGGQVKREFLRLSEYVYRRDECKYGAEIIFQPTITGSSLRVAQGFGAKVRVDWKSIYRLGEPLTFAGRNATVASFLGRGWSVGEAWGRWTDGPRATMTLALGSRPTKDPTLVMSLYGFVRQANPKVDVDVVAGGEVVAHWVVTNAGDYRDYTAPLPARLFGADGQIDIEFRIADPKSPKELGENSDVRKLGLGVKTLTIKP